MKIDANSATLFETFRRSSDYIAKSNATIHICYRL